MRRGTRAIINLAVVSTVAVLLSGCCCPTGAEQQEFSYENRLDEIDKLIAEDLEGKDAKALKKQRKAFVARYADLPEPGPARGEKLGDLHREMSTAVEKYSAVAEELRQTRTAVLVEKYKGVWRGGGVTLQIGPGAQVQYSKMKGGSSKSVNAPIARFTEKSFEVGALGITTTFRIDKPLYEEDGKWKMRVDGTDLIRVKEF
jgi:hypothetical protein